MSGRPVRLLTAATLVAAASLISISTASAGCYSCGPTVSYAAPVVTYQAPVVYSYAPAVRYAAPSCGCGGYAASAPMYVVNQGPTYNAPVTIDAEQEPSYGYRRAYPYYGAGGGIRWHRRHWHRGYGHRGFGYRHGYRHHGYRYGGRFSMRHPIVGPGGIYRGPRHPIIGPRGIYRGPRHAVGGRMHIMRAPGFVHPKKMP